MAIAASKRLVCSAGLLLLGSCSASYRTEIRPIGSWDATVAAPMEDSLINAEAQLALGNVGLSLELFRKVLRQSPINVRAALGAALSYEKMRRFDLSRIYYEQALANAPTDTKILAALANSLDLQGKHHEAEAFRQEIVAREAVLRSKALNGPTLQAAVESTDTLLKNRSVEAERLVPLADEAAATLGSTITVSLGQPERAKLEMTPVASKTGTSTTIVLPPARTIAAPSFDKPTKKAARLERLSTREVALVTTSTTMWLPIKTRERGTLAFSSPNIAPQLRILNGARIKGLAARTRSYLESRGWRRIEVGDAQSARSRTVLLYPLSHRRLAMRLAKQFEFPVALQSTRMTMTLILGAEASNPRPGPKLS